MKVDDAFNFIGDIAARRPDVIVVQVGSNDQNRYPLAADLVHALTSLVYELWRVSPVVVVMGLLPRYGHRCYNVWAAEINTLMATQELAWRRGEYKGLHFRPHSRELNLLKGKEQVHPEWLFLPDRVHLSTRGNCIFHRGIRRAIGHGLSCQA